MRKAFLFTVIFVLLFTTFLLLSVFYLRMIQMNELSIAQTKNTTRIIYVLDDVKTDLLNFLELSLNIESNSTHTILNISDVLPALYANPIGSLAEYKSFMNGTYSNQTNLLNPATNLSTLFINTSSFESSPSILFVNSDSSLNMQYKYNNLSKNELVVNGSNLVRSYSIAMKLNRTCAGGNCANATLGGGQPKVDNSTRALWHFDEESGTTVYDSSGNGNTGNFYGTPSRVGGRFLAALQFVASDHDHVVVNDSNSLDITGSFTVELWFRQPDVTSLAWLLNKANTTNHNDSNYAIWIDADNKIRGSIADGAGDQNLTSTTIVQPNRWYHVAFTADGTTLKIYINGVLENSTYQTITPAANSLDLLIGARSTTAMYHFNGTIDEVAIYSRAKSAEEIAADANLFHWDWGPIAINNNLSAAWHFNEGTGNFTYDSSGNSNMITFTGSETIILTPSSIHKAYNINSTYADDPFLATAEMNYSKIDESDDIRESSSASYSNTLTRPCQAAGTCSCTGSEIMCWTFEACVASNCGYTCPAVGNASNTGNSCTISASGCSQGCAYCAE